MAGQTINDRLLAARHSIAGQGLAKSVCKATTEEMIGPKKKHLDYLVHCTNEPNVSIPQLANLLVERSQSTNWVVVYKALITVHHLLAYGNERFTQYLASSNSSFQLSNFLDKSGVQGAVGARIGYDMSPFIRRYAKYLNEKALSYRTVAFDFCKVKRQKEEGSLRMMNADKLLKTLPVLQAQLDALLEFDCTANDLTNGVINMCFMLLFRDLIRLFACYNDAIINLLEKYFDMNKKQCRDALDLYKKFLIRMDRVGEVLKVAENVGIDKGDIPDLTNAPGSLLDALESHLAALEGKKGSAANTPTQTASAQKNVASGMGALSSTGSSFGVAAASARLDAATSQIDDALARQALAEEEAAMSQYKSKIQSPTNGSVTGTNPFLKEQISGNAIPIVDLFGSESVPQLNAGHNTGKTSDDLLQLGNPFADMFTGPAAPTANNLWSGGGPAPVPASNGFAAPHANAFVSDANFTNIFGNNDSAAALGGPNPFMEMGGLGGVPMASAPPMAMGGSPARPSQPKSALDDLNDTIRMAMGGSPSKPSSNSSPVPTVNPAFGSPARQPAPLQMGTASSFGFDGLGDVLRPAQPASSAHVQSSQPLQPSSQPNAHPGKVLTGDLDSSLASLANNLTINKSAAQAVKSVQWNSPKNAAKGGASWSPQPMQATTGAGYRPMAQGIQLNPMPHTFHTQHIYNMPGMGGPAMGAPMAPMGARPALGAQPNQQQQPVQLDPFGAL